MLILGCGQLSTKKETLVISFFVNADVRLAKSDSHDITTVEIGQLVVRTGLSQFHVSIDKRKLPKFPFWFNS